MKFLLMCCRSVYVLQSMLNPFFFYISDFGDVLLSGFRALSEQRPIAYDYSNFKLVDYSLKGRICFYSVYLFRSLYLKMSLLPLR